MYYKNTDIEYNGCSGRGMCSIAPNISSFQEVMITVLRIIAYYIIKLEQIKIDCADIKQNLIESLSNLITSTVYTDEQLLDLIVKNYGRLLNLKHSYIAACKKENIPAKNPKIPFTLKSDTGLSGILGAGQRMINDKNKGLNTDLKCYSELLLVVIKSVSLSLVKLFDYEIFEPSAQNLIIEALNLYNSGRISIPKYKNYIAKLADIDSQLWMTRKSAQLKTFGKISQTDVSFSASKGKAILVSGSSLADLYSLLESAQGESVDIYTHGDLLIAHAFEKFKKFKNLKGHFGSTADDCVLDFAIFPGPVVLTRHSSQNIEYLIRGRLFTTESPAPKGVTLIKDNDFSGVFKAAYKAKGFSKGKNKPRVTVGYNSDELLKKIDSLSKKLKSKKIKNLLLFGISNYSKEQAEYFDKLLSTAPDDTFVISFSYKNNSKNLIHINIANNFPQQLAVLEMLFEKISLKNNKLVIFLTKCDTNTLSIMINLKQQGAKNMYLSTCPPTIINPAVMKTFMNLYSIKAMSPDPQADIAALKSK